MIIVIRRLIFKSEAVTRRWSVKKAVLRNFTKYTWKHVCYNFFFNRVTGLGPLALLKKRLWHRCFPVIFVKFLRSRFFTEQLRATASVVFRFSNNGHTYSIYFKKNCFVRRILRLCILVILSKFCVQKISYMKVKVESAGYLLLLCKHDVIKPFCMCANWENIMVNGEYHGLWHRCFPVNFLKFLRTLFFTEQLPATASVAFRFSNNGHTYPIYLKKKCLVRRILRLCILVILSTFAHTYHF